MCGHAHSLPGSHQNRLDALELCQRCVAFACLHACPYACLFTHLYACPYTQVRRAIRKILRIPVEALSEKEVLGLFCLLDNDDTGRITLEQFGGFIKDGPRLTKQLLGIVHARMRRQALGALGLDWEQLLMKTVPRF